MKKRTNLAFGAAVLAAMLVASGASAANDVEDGTELVHACTVLLAEGTSAGSEGERCKDFLIGMVKAQEETLTLGQPFRAERLGPDEDERACFELPDKLPFAGFAQQVVSYASEYPEMAKRPAYELAARALEAKYPCDPEDMKQQVAPAE